MGTIENTIDKLTDKLISILNYLDVLKRIVENLYRQNRNSLKKEFLSNLIRNLEEIINSLSNVKKEYHDIFYRYKKLEEIGNILNNINKVIEILSSYLKSSIDKEEINIETNIYSRILDYLDNAYKKINNIIYYYIQNKNNIITDIEKSQIQKKLEEEKTDKEVKIKEEASKDKLEEKKVEEEISEKPEEEKQKKKTFSIIFKIFLVISIIFSFYLIFVLGRIIEAIILTTLFYLAYSLFDKKSFGSIIIRLSGLIVLYLVIYIISYTEFSRVICLYTGTCPREAVRESEKEISKIKENILETVNKIQKIIENPELYFIESRAEAQATRESYYYMFNIESINYIPPNYIFFDEGDKDMNAYPVTIFYTVRYSLPLDRDFNIKFDSYCLIIPEFDLKCLTDPSGSNLGINKTLDGLMVFFDEKEHVFKGREASKYGLQNFRCLIPEFTVNIENCADMSQHPFYILNRFLVLLSNVTTRTVYKFLVAEESLLTKAILENKDLYFYLGLNKYDYDIGYFEGFLDYPKINIIRLGVLSEYPVIKFKDMDSINDAIYVSLPNIERLFDIKDLEVEIIYNPNQLDISLDPKFVGIKTSIYSFSCEKFTGKIKCKADFLKSYDAFNRNRYIIEYKKYADRFFFFIPINIRFSKNFVEYSEVVIQARATYGVENYLDNEIKYIPVKLQKI